MLPMLTISIYEDNASLRKSLEQLFFNEPGFAVTGSFAHCTAIAAHVQDCQPDIVLMDIEMPGTDGIEGVQKAIGAWPDCTVVMFTIFDDNDHIFEALCAGAKGYILKKTTNDKLIEALKEIHAGGSYMSPTIARKVMQSFSSVKPKKPEYNLSHRELEILNLLVKGLSYKMIGSECGISIDTVRHHIKNIYQKLHVNSNVEAVKKAIKNYLL
jgi:DNA-binding NarL/FixJ family response regulator